MGLKVNVNTRKLWFYFFLGHKVQRSYHDKERQSDDVLATQIQLVKSDTADQEDPITCPDWTTVSNLTSYLWRMC